MYNLSNSADIESLLNSHVAPRDANADNKISLIREALCSDPEWVHKQNELFNSAEHWLNYLGIKTRTEYGNLLPTYNLFLEIGEYLQRRLTEENDE